MARRIKIVVNTGFAACKHEDYEDLPDNWDEMSEDQQTNYLDECAIDAMNNYIDCAAWVEEE